MGAGGRERERELERELEREGEVSHSRLWLT
jgi:hypothetical protein